jgi:hypothetical protein
LDVEFGIYWLSPHKMQRPVVDAGFTPVFRGRRPAEGPTSPVVTRNGSVEPGRHTRQVRSGRNSSRTKTFDATDGEIVSF